MSAPLLNKEVFRFLEGCWKIERHFEGSYRGAFTGEAGFTPSACDASTYDYAERGNLIDGEGKQFDAKQCYRYRLADDKVQVFKKEDSEWMLMHELDFKMDESLATASHVHLCGQDHYSTVYSVDLSAGWEVAYSVNGPKKDYRIFTRYIR